MLEAKLLKVSLMLHTCSTLNPDTTSTCTGRISTNHDQIEKVSVCNQTELTSAQLRTELTNAHETIYELRAKVHVPGFFKQR